MGVTQFNLDNVFESYAILKKDGNFHKLKINNNKSVKIIIIINLIK